MLNSIFVVAIVQVVFVAPLLSAHGILTRFHHKLSPMVEVLEKINEIPFK
jgi:hypothetical protein